MSTEDPGSEPQRWSTPATGAAPGGDDPPVPAAEEPPAEAAPDPQAVDPGGYPHEPSPEVPRVPADDPRPETD